MATGSLHVQTMTFPDSTGLFPEFYAMQASCNAHAEEPARSDGLFTYLEGLGSIPGAGGGLANVEDVVGYCLEHQAHQATGPLPESATSDGSSTFGPADGADSTGAGSETPGTTGELPEPPTMPLPCGPYATERFWVRPTNNFGSWNETSGGVGSVGAATFTASIASGGIAYTMFPCDRAADAKCLRIDQLSVQVAVPDAGLVMHLGLVEESTLMPVTAEGTFEVPAGTLHLAARYAWDHRERFHVVANDRRASGRLDTISRSIRIEGLGVSSKEGNVSATLSLAASLSNSQPSTSIVESRDTHGRLVFTAESSDPDFDPIVHQWMILGVGSWRGESIAPSLPPGRHAVIVYADDVHRARGVAARWVEVATPRAD